MSVSEAHGKYLVAQTVKNLPAMQETQVQSELGRSPGKENGHSLQYSCLEYSMNRGAWWTKVRGVAKRHDLVTNTFTFTEAHVEDRVREVK